MPSRVHPRRPVAGREAEYGVGNQKVMLGAGLKEEMAVAVALAHPVLPNHSFPGRGILSNACIEVTKDDELVGVWDLVDGSIQVLIELALRLFWVGHCGSVGADDGSKLFSIGEGESHRHKAVVDPFRYAVQLANEWGLHSKTNSCFTSLFSSSSTPEEGVASSSFAQLTLSGQSGLTESGNVDLIPSQLVSNQCSTSVRSV